MKKENTTPSASEKIIALASFLEEKDLETISETSYNDCEFETDEGDYLVYTDSEADDAEDEQLEQYIEDCVLHELPEAYRQYFDNEAFKRDCRFDGRGHTLSSYDGNENEEMVSGTTYYIYRTN